MAQNANEDKKDTWTTNTVKICDNRDKSSYLFIHISAHPPWKPEKIMSVSSVTNQKFRPDRQLFV